MNRLILLLQITPTRRYPHEPPPTCPFISQQCQRTSRHQNRTSHPTRSLRAGRLASVYEGDLPQRKPKALTASVISPLSPPTESVNSHFQEI